MNSTLSKYLFYYPTTLIKGENVWGNLCSSRNFQYLKRDEIAKHHLTHLKKLVNHAYNNSAYYKEKFDQAGINPKQLTDISQLKDYPFLSKEDLVNNQADIYVKKRFTNTSTKTTGGSTGTPVTLLKDATALAKERAVTWRSYEWCGVTVGSPQARFWGEPLFKSQRLKSRLIDLIANRKRLSAFELTDEQMRKYHKQIWQFKPKYFYGYVSVLTMFARFIEKNKLSIPDSLKCVITTSEVLSESDRELMETIFHIPIFNEYGCGEVGSIAHQCEKGNMHLMEDNLIVEIDSDNGDSGEIIVTDLFNFSTPLIRYKVGDYASTSNIECSCGRSLLTIGNIHGRAYDRIVMPDGSFCHPELIMYVFEHLKSFNNDLQQFQVIQNELLDFEIRLVTNTRNNPEIEDYLTSQLQQRISNNIKLSFIYTHEIKRENSGKIRLIKSLVK